MKRFIAMILMALLTISMLSVTGCTDKQESEYVVYYLDLEGTSLVAEGVDLEGATIEKEVQFLLDKLQSSPENGDYRQTIPNNVEINDIEFNGYMATIYFSEEYSKMSVVEEVLVRAAIVKTLIQVENLSYVSFFVGGTPLLDATGTYVGSMSGDSFVENPGEQINSSQTASVTLYFSSDDGSYLVKETRNVHYSSNMSIEKVIITQLINGPRKSGTQATIPADTKVISIITVDNVCYVNLDETFANQNEAISEEVVLYSIVDSLTELPNVDRVQISINGDNNRKVRYTFKLATYYERNEAILEEKNKDSSETTEITETTEVNNQADPNAGVSGVVNPTTAP